MTQLHILILSVSAGAGHVRAAQALCATAEQKFPRLRVTHIDVMDLVSVAFRKVYSESYIKLVETAPLLWTYLYQSTDRTSEKSPFDRLRRSIERLNTRNLDDELKRLNPDAIICTHFLPAELLSRRIDSGQPTPPVWVQVTDFDVHGLWIHPHLHGYFVATDEVAWRIATRSASPTPTYITGIPIMPQFSGALSRAECAAELGLDSRKPTLLLMSGGAGIGGIEILAEQLVAVPHDLQIIALAGKNQSLLTTLQALSKRHPGKLLPIGFTHTIECVMAAADIAITKPGGLTTSECLVMSLPMIVVSPIPGQEERNSDFLLESGAALKAIDSASLEYKVRLLLEEPDRLATMRKNMRFHAKPHAAASVLDIVMEQLQLA